MPQCRTCPKCGLDHGHEYGHTDRCPETPKTARVFAYGTLMDADVVSRVLGRRYHASQMYESQVIGYERRKAGFYYAVPMEGAIIKGRVLTGLSLYDLEALDRYEGVPHLYTRAEINRIAGEPVYLYVGESIARRGR